MNLFATFQQYGKTTTRVEILTFLAMPETGDAWAHTLAIVTDGETIWETRLDFLHDISHEK